MTITKIHEIIKPIKFARQTFINLRELKDLLETGFRIEMEECLITPSYIQDNKQYELYHYELCCTNEYDSFDQFILELTHKNKIEEIPEEIYTLRKNCFSRCDEPCRLAEYLRFLFNSESLKEEIKTAFGFYVAKNLYAVIYS